MSAAIDDELEGGVDFTCHSHPVLAVECPTCFVSSGVACQRPSGHRAAQFHAARKQLADAVFIKQHGEDAAIDRTEDGGWTVSPHGRALDGQYALFESQS